MEKMSKTSKNLINSIICADCGALDPKWASVNRGILLCSDCCIIHRSLGRHISQIKSIDKSVWCPTQFSMVMTLNKSGANNIWEYTLIGSPPKGNCKKPKPKDSLNVKTEFIRLKHGRLTWAIRPSNELNLELNQNLHASARSANLHTSLRLLVQGADPNYFHEEKGSTPLHVAAKSNQMAQAELLLVYGADPCTVDVMGRTPVEIARQAGNIDLADRLLEVCYQITDRLTYFLCGRVPDHKAGQHLLVPDIKEIDASVLSRSKLQTLPNRLFEELVVDVFEEVDRREIETIWQKTVSTANELGAVPFLPVHPHLSSTRNQARQKLARLDTREFNSVVLDILIDARRRQHISRFSGLQTPVANNVQKKNNHISQISDDEPLYDSVASDDDYAALTPVMISEKKSISLPSPTTNVSLLHLSKTAPISSTPPGIATGNTSGIGRQRLSTSDPSFHTDADNSLLFDRLRESDSTIAELREQVNTLRSLVERLSLENCDLRSKITTTTPTNVGGSIGHIGDNSSLFYDQRITHGNMNDSGIEERSLGNGHSIDVEPVQDIRHKINQRPASMYEARDRDWQTVKNQREEQSRPSITQSLYQCSNAETTVSSAATTASLFEEISRRTNQVTRRIQELWSCIQNNAYKDGAIPCAERIRVAVDELTAVIPQNRDDTNSEHQQVVKTALRQLITGTARLQVECAGLQRASTLGQTTQTETYLHLVRSCAYDIAKATKLLVTKFENQTS